MPTKKDIFLSLMNLLKDNVSAVSNRVYAAYPKKKPILPLIVISDIHKSIENPTIDKGFMIEEVTVNITIYTKTAQELDELSETVLDLLKNNAVLSAKPKTLEEIDSADVVEADNSVMHFRTIAATYTY